jgi:hypothetical protein
MSVVTPPMDLLPRQVGAFTGALALTDAFIQHMAPSVAPEQPAPANTYNTQ